MASSTRTLFDDDHEAFRDSVRRFLADQVVPHLDQWRADGQVPDELIETAGEFGLLGTAVPEELGGGGTDDLLFTVVLVEEAAAIGAVGLAWAFALHSGIVLPTLVAHADESLTEQWVARLAAGQARTAVAGGSLAGVAGGSAADVFLVVGADQVRVVGADQATVTVVEDALAGREAGHADLEVAADAGVELPAAALAAVAVDVDLWLSVTALAAARAAITMTLDYTAERKAFGQPIVKFENTRHRFAELDARLAAAELLVDGALVARAAGQLTAATAAQARLVAEGVHDEAVDVGMQFHGGYGYMREYAISYAFADARFLRVVGLQVSDAREAIASGIGI